MKLSHSEDTDSLYIDLSTSSSSASREVTEGVVIDLAKHGQVVDLDLLHASKRLDLSKLAVDPLPLPMSA